MNANGKRVLVVDDEEGIRREIVWRLSNEGFEIEEASNGEEAVELCSETAFDLVITDLNMPISSVDGLELLKHLKATGTAKVIVMTGFSKLFETKSAYDYGADHFLSKPFELSDLLAGIEKLLGLSTEKRQSEQDFQSIDIDEFLEGSKIRHDIYFKLTRSKFIKVATKGEGISGDRIQKYKEKGLRHLYMTKADFKDYMLSAVGLGKIASQKKNVLPPERVRGLVLHTNELIGRHLANDAIDQVSFAAAVSTLSSTIAVIGEDEDFNDLLTQLKDENDQLYAHSVAVSIYSLIIAKNAGWRSQGPLTQVSLAGIFHDVGKKEIPKELLAKSRNKMSQAEIRQYESHVERGLEILKGVGNVPEGILQAVAQHHECVNGTGYPNHLDRAKICPLAMIVAVADAFVKLILPLNKAQSLHPQEAIAQMRMLYGASLDAELFKALELGLQKKAS